LLLFGNNLTPSYMIGILLAALIGMTVHEFAHNYVAHLMGDPTPSRQGRLTLNPMMHIYWPGFIMFVLIGFGILGLAPINPRLMRNPRWGSLLATAAGPCGNLLVAACGAVLWRMVGIDTLRDNDLIQGVLFMMVWFNVWGFLFNLLPLFPLDGWHIMLSALPAEQAYAWQRNAQNTQLVFIALIMLNFIHLPGFDPMQVILFDPINEITRFLLGI